MANDGLPDLQYGPQILRPGPVATNPEAGSIFDALAKSADNVFQHFQKEAEDDAATKGSQYGSDLASGKVAIVRDADGNLVRQAMPTPAIDHAFVHAAELSYISGRELDYKTQLQQAHEDNYDNPEGFKAAAAGIKQSALANLPFGDWAPSIGHVIDQETSDHLGAIGTAKLANTLAQQKSVVDAKLEDNKNDLIALARNHALDTPRGQRLLSDTVDIMRSKASNPAFKEAPEQLDLDVRELQSTLKAEALVGNVEQVYHAQGVVAAKKSVEDTFNNPDLELTEQSRDRFIREGYGRIAELEQERRAAMAEAQLRLGSAVEDAHSAAASAGEWRSIVSPGELAAAYGPERAGKMVQQLDFTATTHKRLQEILLASPDEVAGLVDAEKPKGAGAGFALQQERYQALLGAAAQRQQALAADPVGYLTAASPYVQGLAAAAQKGDPVARQRYNSALISEQQRLGVPANKLAVLGAGQAQTVADQLTNGDPNQAVGTLRAVTAGMTPQQLQIASRQISEKDKAAGIAVAAAQDNPLLASDILIGQRVLAQNPDARPPREQVTPILDGMTGGSPAGFFSSGTGGLFAFAPDARAAALAAADALYARQMVGGKAGTFDPTKFAASLRQVLGNPITYRGQIIAPPRPDMTAGDVNKIVAGLDDAKIKAYGNGQPVDASGRPITAADIAQHGVLTYTGQPGLYRVMFPGQGHLGVAGGSTFMLDLGKATNPPTLPDAYPSIGAPPGPSAKTTRTIDNLTRAKKR